jgi:hypothetical protein
MAGLIYHSEGVILVGLFQGVNSSCLMLRSFLLISTLMSLLISEIFFYLMVSCSCCNPRAQSLHNNGMHAAVAGIAGI